MEGFGKKRVEYKLVVSSKKKHITNIPKIKNL